MLNRIAAPVKCRARQWHSAFGRIAPMGGEPRLSRRFDPLDRDRDFAAENFHTISTDTHIDHLVILPVVLLRGANKNAAGTVHFEALLDQNPLVTPGNTVRHRPRGTASGGGTCGRIFSAVKKHAGVEARLGIDGFAANKIKKPSATAFEILKSAFEIETKVLRRLQRTQRGDGIRNA